MNWKKTIRAARGKMTQEEAAAALGGREMRDACPVATLRDWEQGRRTPPRWVQCLIIAHLLRVRIVREAKGKSK